MTKEEWLDACRDLFEHEAGCTIVQSIELAQECALWQQEEYGPDVSSWDEPEVAFAEEVYYWDDDGDDE